MCASTPPTTIEVPHSDLGPLPAGYSLALPTQCQHLRWWELSIPPLVCANTSRLRNERASADTRPGGLLDSSIFLVLQAGLTGALVF